MRAKWHAVREQDVEWRYPIVFDKSQASKNLPFGKVPS